MARMTGLGGLLDALEAEKTAPPQIPAEEPAAPKAPAEPAPKKPAQAKKVAAPKEVSRPKPAPAAKVAPQAGEGPRYLALTRKEARFTDDQLDALTVLTRRLNKDRRGAGERLTDNTLIRVAVDLLLSQQDKLDGATEDELRKSVGL